ncbi:hypothetical protein [Rufibacter roseus]|uniref:Uncharacterized protein n=1 Tax=Rufibacter roseus TaxID=1567108 RepID=A0ABW2DNK8_9BACT|nr:hypothetical protein [Rufibacter roseus]
MALYLFNISIDKSDTTLDPLPAELENNDIESFVELILENVLCLEDIIEEYDDTKTEEHLKKKSNRIDVFYPFKAEPEYITKSEQNSQTNLPFKLYQLTKGFSKLDIPPPKV